MPVISCSPLLAAWKNNLTVTRGAFYTAGLALLAVLLFWQFLPFQEPGEIADYIHAYRPAALNLLAGRGYTADGESFLTRYPPGFPLLLAGAFKLAALTGMATQTIIGGFQLVGFVLAALFFYALAMQWWPPFSALLCTVALITYPPLLWLTAQPFTEISYLFFFFAGLFLFWRGVMRRQNIGLFFGCGTLLGLGALIRPMGAFSGFVLAASLLLLQNRWQLSRSKTLTGIMLLGLGQLLVWLPWHAYVYAKNDRLFFLSTAFVPALRDGLRFGVNDKGYRQSVALPTDVAALQSRIHTRFEEMNNAQQVIKIVTEESQGARLALVKLYCIKALRCWYGTDSARREQPLLLLQVCYVAVLALAMAQSWRQGAFTRNGGLIILLLLLGSWAMTTLALSILRYMTPAITLLFLFLPSLWKSPQRAVTEDA